MTPAAKRAALIGMLGAAILVIFIFWSRWFIIAISLALISIGAGVVLTRRQG